jgi:hypothetical protein
MSRRSRVYRSVFGVRLEVTPTGPPARKLSPRPCTHYHSTVETAGTCLAARVREGVRDAVPVELAGTIEYSHSRHDWFPLKEPDPATRRESLLGVGAAQRTSDLRGADFAETRRELGKS